MSTRDVQQYRAYNWEAGFTRYMPNKLSTKALKAIVAKACRLYRIPPPTLQVVTKNKRDGKKLTSFYDPNDHHIVLRPRHTDLNTALHETAHAITDYVLGPWATAAHGKEWMGVFMTLLARFRVAPRVALEAHARKRGLKFVNAKSSAPRAFRIAHAAKARKARSHKRMIRDLLRKAA